MRWKRQPAHTTTGVIKRYNIDAVCSPVLDAVVFDLTDAVTAGRFDRAVALVGELLAQKNNEVMIFTAITRHIQRLYAAKLCAENRGGEKQLMEMIGSKSPYYARQIQNAHGVCRSAGCERRRRCARRPMPHSRAAQQTGRSRSS